MPKGTAVNRASSTEKPAYATQTGKAWRAGSSHAVFCRRSNRTKAKQVRRSLFTRRVTVRHLFRAPVAFRSHSHSHSCRSLSCPYTISPCTCPTHTLPCRASMRPKDRGHHNPASPHSNSHSLGSLPYRTSTPRSRLKRWAALRLKLPWSPASDCRRGSQRDRPQRT